MDNVQVFINEYLGKKVDVDHYPKSQPYQCKDLVQKYVTECLGLPKLPQGNAGEMFHKAPKTFQRIENKWWRIPKKGDIMIWDKKFNKYGHIAIVMSANMFSFISADQNWSAPKVTYETHSYLKPPVIGWLRKK